MQLRLEHLPLDLQDSLKRLSDGSIVLGARRSRGLGRVVARSWRAKRFDLDSASGWIAWITSDAERPLGEGVYAKETPAEACQHAVPQVRLSAQEDRRRRVTGTIELALRGGLLVRSGGTSPDAADVAHLESGGQSILSGTSLAGALRAHAAHIARVVRQQLNSRRIIDAQGRFLIHPANGSTLPYYDTNNDGRLTPLDALMVINAINANITAPQAEGEAGPSAAHHAPKPTDLRATPSLTLGPHPAPPSPDPIAADTLIDTRTGGRAWWLDNAADDDDDLVPWLEHNGTSDEPDFTTCEDIDDTLDEIAGDVCHALNGTP